jgi:pimeloyl-ACP methyl ester carboxylesterase
VTRAVTETPRVNEYAVVAGVPTTVVRPGSGRRWPELVFFNGVTARGRFHPDVQRLARALARVGFLVLVPDLPGMRTGEVTGNTLTAAIGVVRAAEERPDADGGRVGLVGVSLGASLALLSAEQPSLADRVTVVAGIAPYTDLRNVVRLATTGYTLQQGRLVPYAAEPFMSLVIARSLIATLPAGRERDAILTQLLALSENTPHPLALFRTLNLARLSPEVRAVVELLANRSPSRFGRLYAALAPALRASERRLSPLAGAGGLRAPVDIASAPHDKYFPLSETRDLAQAATHTRVELTVTDTLHHAIPSLSLPDLTGLLAFDDWVVHVVEAARDT